MKEACFRDSQGREPGDGDSSGPRPETCCLKRAVHLPRSRQRDFRQPSASANITQPQMVPGREICGGVRRARARQGPCSPPPPPRASDSGSCRHLKLRDLKGTDEGLSCQGGATSRSCRPWRREQGRKSPDLSDPSLQPPICLS